MSKLYTKALTERINGKLMAIASEEIEDREGEILSIDGWDLKNYKKNPVILWAHNPTEPPIGIAKNIRIIELEGKRKLVFEPVFHEITELAKAIKKMFEEGILKTFSVGFLPREQDGNRYIRQELLEISAVNVPALPTAMVYEKSGLKEEVVNKILGIGKGVIPYKDTGKAPEETEWDGNAEVAAADIEDLKIMCAWFDSEKPNVKSSYKLPHHKASGGHVAVWRGVAAAMAALMGARGGVDIPESDKRGVYNHLKKHYEDFGKEAPEFRNADEIIEKYVTGDFIIETKPEITENYIHIPIRDASDFIENSFRTIDISKKEGIKAVIGKLKSDPQGPTHIQKYLFDKDKWTMEEAQEWVREHKLLEKIEEKISKIENKIAELAIKPTGIGRFESSDKSKVARRRLLQAIHKISENLILQEKQNEKR